LAAKPNWESKSKEPHRFDLNLEVAIQPDGGEENVVTRTNFKYMYWNICQQLAHHTVNGCNVKVGDMCASGTISGPTPDSYGEGSNPFDAGVELARANPFSCLMEVNESL
jgi:fumarylacetoacetase